MIKSKQLTTWNKTMRNLLINDPDERGNGEESPTNPPSEPEPKHK